MSKTPFEQFEQMFVSYRDQENEIVCENQTLKKDIERLELIIQQKQQTIKDNVSKNYKLQEDRDFLFIDLIKKGDISTIAQLLEKGFTLPPDFAQWSVESGSVDCLDLSVIKDNQKSNIELIREAIKLDQFDCASYLLLNCIDIKKWDSSEKVSDYYDDDSDSDSDSISYCNNNNRKIHWFNKLTRCAAIHNNLRILKLLVEKGCGVEKGVLENAVISDSIECLEYAYSKGARFSWYYVDQTCHEYGKYELREAATKKDPTILKFLIEVAQCGRRTRTDLDIRGENLDLRSNSAIWFDPKVFLATSKEPSVECMRYLWSIRDRYGGIEWSSDYSENIIVNGQVDILKEIIKLGCPIYTKNVISAITNNKYNVLEFLWNDTKILKTSLNLFLKRDVIEAIYSSIAEGLYDCIKFLFKHIYGPWNKDLYDNFQSDYDFNSNIDLDDPFWRWFLFDQPAVTDDGFIADIKNKQRKIKETKEKLNFLHQEKLVIKDIVVYNICPYI